MDVAVVGAGVVGLSTAAVLVARGHDVTVVAEHAPAETVSAVAGGLWFPYRAGPADRVERWAAVTRAHFEELAGTHGVQLLPAQVDGCVQTLPFVHVAAYLAWLADGLRIEQRRVSSLDEVDADVVVACPGLAARELLADDSVYSVRGVTVEVARPPGPMPPVFVDDTGPQPTYVLPRGDDALLLGGRADERDEHPEPGPARPRTSSPAAPRCCPRSPPQRSAPSVAGCARPATRSASSASVTT